MLMICTDDAAERARSAEESSAISQAYGKFGEEMGRRGVLRGGARLRPSNEAKTVRVQNGKVLTSDGPFAETKEQLGGYYVVDCKDEAEAIEIASKIPNGDGKIEVRPIWDM